MTPEHREEICDELSREFASSIIEHPRVTGFHGLGWRKYSDLENAIYGWLLDHARFSEDA